MKKIPLTQGKSALVDDEDYEWLNQWKWHLNQNKKHYMYAKRNKLINNKNHKFSMHVEIMKKHGLWEESKIVDHIDRWSLNNQKSNLRMCTRAQNSRNRGANSGNSSGLKGVSWHKHRKKWQAHIKFCGKQVYLGIFKEKNDASKAYNEASSKFFGEFASLNKV